MKVQSNATSLIESKVFLHLRKPLSSLSHSLSHYLSLSLSQRVLTDFRGHSPSQQGSASPINTRTRQFALSILYNSYRAILGAVYVYTYDSLRACVRACVRDLAVTQLTSSL